MYLSSTWIRVTVLSVRLCLQAAALRAQITAKKKKTPLNMTSTPNSFVSASTHKHLQQCNFHVTAEGYMFLGGLAAQSVVEISTLQGNINCSVILHIKAEPWSTELGSIIAYSPHASPGNQG